MSILLLYQMNKEAPYDREYENYVQYSMCSKAACLAEDERVELDFADGNSVQVDPCLADHTVARQIGLHQADVCAIGLIGWINIQFNHKSPINAREKEV